MSKCMNRLQMHGWPFGYGRKANENQAVWHGDDTYSPWEIYLNHQGIHRAVESLRDGTIAETEGEHAVLMSIYHSLLEARYSSMADKYLVLRDLPEYYETQKKVEEMYAQPSLWAQYAIQNIAAMGTFSTDRSIHNYAENIWGLLQCPVSSKELEIVRKEYSDHDKFRIF